MAKIIAKEVPPESRDFSYYFDNDGLTSAGGEDCAVYILDNDRHYYGANRSGFNYEEFNDIVARADEIIDAIEELYSECEPTVEDLTTELNWYFSEKVLITPEQAKALAAWAQDPFTIDKTTNNAKVMANYLSIVKDKPYKACNASGYLQSDWCEAVYCADVYSDDDIKEICDFWLGCGTEYCIDDVYGFFVPDNIRWKDGDTLKNYLADSYGCSADDLVVYEYVGERTTTTYVYKDEEGNELDYDEIPENEDLGLD